MTNTLMETLHSVIGSDNVIVKLVLLSEEDEVLFETSKPVMGYKVFNLVPEEYREKPVRFTQFHWVNGDPMLTMTIAEGKKATDCSVLKSVINLFGDKDTRICIIRSGIGRIYFGPMFGFMSSISDVYNPSILYAPVERVYNEVDQVDKKITFFIRIGDQYDHRGIS